MTTLLLVLSMWSRPEFVPVGPADMARAGAVEAELLTTGPDRAVLPRQGRVAGRMVIGWESEAALSGLARWLAENGAEVERCDVGGRFVVARRRLQGEEGSAIDGLLAEARALPGVRFAEPDYWVRVCRFPNDTYFATQQWDKWVMYADLAWDLSTGSNSIKVAVVDNGCDYEHPDLAANFNTQELGYDFVGQDLTPRPDNYAIPDAFHGTHVAGIIGAVIDNSRGVAGWAQCRLVAVRVLNDSGSGMTSDLASGIRWAVDHGCKVLNMSLSGSSAPSELVEACDYAEEHGVLLVAASGNDGAGTIGYPAALGSCIAVGSTAENSRLADYSNHGPQQELVAPGTNVLSCAPGGNYVTASGTSMASPQVSGVAALVWSANIGLSAVRIRSLLDAAAIDMGATGRDNWYGHGLLNGRRGLELALADGVRAMSGHSEPVRVRVGSGSVLLPEWCTQARAFDITGREVARGSGRLQLRPGVYALRMQGAAGEQCEKVLVAN